MTYLRQANEMRYIKFIKKYRELLESGDTDAAAAAYRDAEREIRKAATKGVVPKRRADRSVSRLAKRLEEMKKAS